jgi:hypothetical protein
MRNSGVHFIKEKNQSTMANTIQILPLGAPAPEAIYRAYALQPGVETLLAEGIGNEKGECKLAYEWAGGKTLHVQVRAFSFEGVPLGASELVYNAKVIEQVRFKVEQAPAPKEFEGIGVVLGRMLPEGQKLGASEGVLVMKTIGAYAGEIPKAYRDRLSEARLDYRVHSEALAEASGLPAAFIYAINRIAQKKQELTYFLDTDENALLGMLDKAEQQNLVSPLDRTEISRQLEALRKSRNPVPERYLWGRVLQAGDDMPLPGLLLQVYETGTANSFLGEDHTDLQGRFYVGVKVPAGAHPSWRIEVFRDTNEKMYQGVATLMDEGLDIHLKLPALPDRSTSLLNLAEATGWDQLHGHLGALESNGIKSLRDIREKGLDKTALPADVIRRLEAQAQLDLLPSARPAAAADLIAQGFDSPLHIAQAPKSAFLARFRDQYGDFIPAGIHEEAEALEAGLSNLWTQETLDPGKFTQVDPADASEPFEDPLDMIPQSCGCEHCNNAVSPAAYLVELLHYALRHVQKENATITLTDLETAFHQPFGGLQTTCSDSAKTIRQIRLHIEVLHSYLAAQGLPAPNTPEEARHRQSVQNILQQVYEELLERLNTSYNAIRDVQNGTDEEKVEAAKALGIPLQVEGQDTLEALFLRPDEVQETNLEKLFGWRDTARDPLSDPAGAPLFLQWRKALLRQHWQNADWSANDPDSARPWINPDLIGLDWLVEPLDGIVSDLWHLRRDVLHNQWESYRQIRENAANDLAAWAALFASPETVEQIRARDENATAYLDTIHHHIEEGSPVTGHEWENVYHILVQHYKTAQYTSWRQQEIEEGIYLNPDFFRIPPQNFDVDLPEWRAKRADWRSLRNLLTSRIEQDQAAATALSAAVAGAEENLLPAWLRHLIEIAEPAGDNLYDKVSRLSGRLLADFAADACKTGTRIQTAIETVQQLIWGLRTGQLEDTHPQWSLDAEKFDEEWKWLGSYAAWRSAMLVFLYPENLLQPSLRRRQTPVFADIVRTIRNNTQFSPADACELAESYSRYYQDVNNLHPEASVIARTNVVEGACGSKTGKGERTFVYLFARSTVSNKVYFARYEEGDETEQSHWQEAPGLENVLQVAGACVYAVAPEERYIYLFAKTKDGRNETLIYTRYDLQKDAWSGDNNQLERPPGNPNFILFDAVVKKTYRENEPPHLAFRNREGELFARKMNIDGNDWEEADFVMLEANASISSMQTKRLCEMVESIPGEFYLVRETSGAVEYRLFGALDDGQWRRVGAKHCLGAAPWQNNGGMYVFLGNPEGGYKPGYVFVSRPVQEPGWTTIKTLRGLQTYLLTKMSGLDLNEIQVPYAGQVSGLVEFLLLQFEDAPNRDEYNGDNARAKWKVHYKKEVERVLDFFANDRIENKLGQRWLLVSNNLTLFTSEKLQLKKVLELLFDNRKDYDGNGKNHIISLKVRTNPEQEVSERMSILPGLRKIVTAHGKTPLSPYVRVLYVTKPYGLKPPDKGNTMSMNYVLPGGFDAGKYDSILNGNQGLYRSLLFNPQGAQLRNINQELAAPGAKSDYSIRSNYSEAELTLRKGLIRSVFKLHEKARPWIITYQEEAFYFLPVYIALQLQRTGFYQEAADWFRTVYDFNRPPAERKIYYGLVEEENLGPGLERISDWLGDPLNPHAIASTRTNTYTRFTLLSIIRLLIDHANTEFTRYAPESLHRARTLYQTALGLLKLPGLAADPAWCEQIMDEIKQIALQELSPEYTGVWKSIQLKLGKIATKSSLKSAAAWAKGVLAENMSGRERLKTLQEGMHNEYGDLPASSSIANQLTKRDDIAHKAQKALLRHPEINQSLTRTVSLAGKDFTRNVSLLTGKTASELSAGAIEIPWLGNKKPGSEKNAQWIQNQGLHAAEAPGIAYGFCVPDNPLIEAWTLEAEANLYKLHTCRDIAGMDRQPLLLGDTLDVYALPSIGNRSDIVVPAQNPPAPTPYRYMVLIERAKQLANMAQQMESYFLSALEKRDAEMYQRLKAGQEVELTRAGVSLNQLKVREAEDGIVMAELQRDRAEIQEEHYQMLLNEGISDLETSVLTFMIISQALYGAAAAATSGNSLLGFFTLGILGGDPGKGLENLGNAMAGKAKIFEALASYERRKQDWVLNRNLARQDIRIGNQQIRLSQDRLRIVNQEHHISELQSDHARGTLEFLTNKFTNAELYDWMSGVLEGVYASFLQQATAVAQLAEQQLQFERQLDRRFIIQTDYWSYPRSLEATLLGETSDRRGLTGSARLLQDLSLLDQYAFSTDRRKHELSKTISLAQISPVEFQQFRESGTLPFVTQMEWFDRDFPGHYLRLIKRVRVSVLALAPPVDGIRATLKRQGVSYVVSNADRGDMVSLPGSSDTIAFTNPISASGQFEMELQPQNEMRRPFESDGVAASWLLELPKAANQFDYNTIADVLITIDYTALYSDDYRRRVIAKLDRRFSADRAFSFRRDFPDQWYDLNHPEQSNEPMVVQFETLRGDFPANIEGLDIRQVVLYVARKDGFRQEIKVRRLRYQPEGGVWLGGVDDQNLDTVNGILSTRTGYFADWDEFRGKTPVGEWELALTDSTEIRQWFKEEQITDVLFVLTVEGETAAWVSII